MYVRVSVQKTSMLVNCEGASVLATEVIVMSQSILWIGVTVYRYQMSATGLLVSV